MCCISIQKFGCISLHTAGLLIGWFDAVLSCILSILLVVILVILNSIDSPTNEDTELIIAGMIINMAAAGLRVMVSLFLAISVLNFVTSVMMIVGTKKNSHLLLLPWLIHNGIILAFKIILNFALLFHSATNGADYKSVCFVSVLIIVLGIYCWTWAAIYSLFQRIRSTSNQQSGVVYQNGVLSNYKLYINSKCNFEKPY